MARSLLYTVSAQEDGMRIDAALAAAGCYPSRSSAAKHIEDGTVFVNGTVPQKRTIVSAGDTVVYEEHVEDEIVALYGQEIPLDIRYEDDEIIVISKQRGLICHPSHNHADQTLVNALIHRYGHGNLAHVQGEDRPGIVHRLDGDTSGLMICAKDDEAGDAMQFAIRMKNVDRRYIALVHGLIAADTGEIDAPIARNHKTGSTMRVSGDASAREALTSFRVLERFEAGNRDDGYTLVECKLFTGRTHQIRVHMQYIHHCIVGDPLYGSHGPHAQLKLDRQFLHSYRLGFAHPSTGEYFQFTDYLPGDLQAALNRIESRTIGRTAAGEEVIAALKEAADVKGLLIRGEEE
ncbi:MAG: RluA family pseudouridine synthase [Coriobacteriia bacterium]|nr:RluA family pseudouridine synthase [Coriobacteriia bacterium]